MNDRERLKAIGQWADRLSAPGFSFGRWVKSEQRADGAWSMPYFELSPGALDFLRSCTVLPDFDWPAWQHSPHAQALRDDRTALDRASEEQLYKLLTAIIRGDRFSEGTLAEAYESGLLAAIARRARELAGEEDPA